MMITARREMNLLRAGDLLEVKEVTVTVTGEVDNVAPDSSSPFILFNSEDVNTQVW